MSTGEVRPGLCPTTEQSVAIEHFSFTDLDLDRAIDRPQIADPERREQETEAIDQSVKTLSGLTFSAQEQRKLVLAGEIRKWQLHAEPGGNLPQGLMYAYVKTGGGELTKQPVLVPDSAYFGAREDYHEINRRIAKLSGLENRAEIVLRSIIEPGSELNEAVLRHPALEFLRRFDNSPQGGDRPLNQYERNVAEQMIEAEVRQKHGLAVGETIMHGTHLVRELNRRKLWLDDERVPSHDQNATGARRAGEKPTNGIAAMRAHYLPIAFQKLREAGYDPDAITQDDGVEIMPLIRDKETEPAPFMDVADSVIEYFQNEIIKQFTSSSDNLDEVVGRIIYEFFYHNLFPGIYDYDPVTSVDSALTQLFVDETYEKEYFREQIGEFSLRDSDLEFVGEVMKAKGPLKVLRGSEDRYHAPTVSEFATYLSGERDLVSIEDLLESSLNYTISADHSLAGRVIARLWQSKEAIPFEDQLTVPITYDAVVDGYGYAHQDTAPFIPGYQTVARLRGGYARYGLIRAEHDPYTSCDVPAPTENMPELVDWFTTLGAVSIVKKLSAAKSMTIAQLEQIIAENSDYYVPPQGHIKKDSGYLGMYHSKLKPRLHNGRLQLQCIEAAEILHHCISTLYGQDRSMELSGNLVIEDANGKQLAHQLGHVQVLFTDGYRQYVLDATPALRPEDRARLDNADVYHRGHRTGYTSGLSLAPFKYISLSTWETPTIPNIGLDQVALFNREALISELEQEAAKQNDENTEVYDPSLQAKEMPSVKPLTPSEVREQLEGRLMQLFGSSDRRGLYEQLPRPRHLPAVYRQLPHSDPVLRTMFDLMDAEAGEIDREEVAKSTNYIDNYPDIQRRLAKSRGLRFYDELVLKLLDTALKQL